MQQVLITAIPYQSCVEIALTLMEGGRPATTPRVVGQYSTADAAVKALGGLVNDAKVIFKGAEIVVSLDPHGVLAS